MSLIGSLILFLSGETAISAHVNQNFDDIKTAVNDSVTTFSLAVDDDSYLTPISSADSAAPNTSIYYSTTQSKLVFKDSTGTINDLY